MPTPRKPARLWLKPEQYDDAGKVIERATWYIAYGGKRVSTGCREDRREQAEQALSAFKAGSFNGAAGRPALIYFASTAVEGYPVKIGWTAGPVSSRIYDLQIGNPHMVVCLGTILGSREDERAIHREFAASHIRGEWFQRSVELLRFIETRCKDYPDDPVSVRPNRMSGTKVDSTKTSSPIVVDFARTG